MASDLCLLGAPIKPIMPKNYPIFFCLFFLLFTILPDFITIIEIQEGVIFIMTILCFITVSFTILTYSLLKCSDPGSMKKRSWSEHECINLLKNYKAK